MADNHNETEQENPFGNRPQDRIPGETSRAHHYLIMYLEMDNRDLNRFATEKQAIRDTEGRYDDDNKVNATANSIMMWSQKYLWPDRAEVYDNIRDSESEEIARAVREKNYQFFFKNELEMALKVQAMLVRHIESLDKMPADNIEQILNISQAVWKDMKTYVDVRLILKELFADHVKQQREANAQKAEAERRANEGTDLIQQQPSNTV